MIPMRLVMLLPVLSLLAALTGCSAMDDEVVEAPEATQVTTADDEQDDAAAPGVLDSSLLLALVGGGGLVVGLLMGFVLRGLVLPDPAPRPPPAPRRAEVDPALARRLDQLTSQRRQLVDALIDSGDRVDSVAVAQTIARALADVGVHAISPSPGSPFDPTRHIATRGVPTANEGMRDTVAAVETPGYEDDGSILRYARVQVNQYEEPRR